MLSEVIAGIRDRLAIAFGDQCAVYTEKPEQAMEKPCFFIFPERPAAKTQPCFRTIFTVPVTVQYFPKSIGGESSEMLQVADRLFSELELIEAAGVLLRQGEMKFEIVEKVLHFHVTYPYHSIHMETEDVMEELTVSSGLKEETR